MQVINVDMAYDDQTEDLKLDEYNNLDYYSKEETPPNAVVRRLGTPFEGYARMIRLGNTATVYDGQYYSLLPNMLSATNLEASEVQAAVELASAQDGRLTPVDFAVNQDGGAIHSFSLSYLSIDNTVETITAGV